MTISNSLLGLFLFTITFGMSFTVSAETRGYAYRVTSSEKTLIQIARDVYNDERLWKKISYWNNVTPPYALSVGQVLVLPHAPTTALLSENSVDTKDVPEPVFVKQLPSVEQILRQAAGTYIYVVSERAPSLSMVALETYGNKKMAAIIARWNDLAMMSKLALGQQLQLKLPPRFGKTEAHKALVSEWTRLGNAEMVARLKNKNYLNFHPQIAMAWSVTHHPAPVVFDADFKREPAAVQINQPVAEPPADLAAEHSWYGEHRANAIESLLRSISN